MLRARFLFSVPSVPLLSVPSVLRNPLQRNLNPFHDGPRFFLTSLFPCLLTSFAEHGTRIMLPC
jgi:hypothetical protein